MFKMFRHFKLRVALTASLISMITLELVGAGDGGMKNVSKSARLHHGGNGEDPIEQGQHHGGNGHDPIKKHRLPPNYDPREHEHFHDKSRQHKDAGDSEVDGDRHTTTTQRPSTTTEPDWDYICYHLCQTGDGGLACDCDLMPIGK